MKDEKVEKLLYELADATPEQPPAELAEDIKNRIPQQFSRLKKKMDTVNIIIDLRVNKLAAAAVIIVSMILLANIFSGKDTGGAGLLQESKLLIRYFLAKDNDQRGDVLLEMSNIYKSLIEEGKEVVYYGGRISATDGNSVLMHWKLEDGRYRVIFTDSRIKTVNADELIKLQAEMLQNKEK